MSNINGKISDAELDNVAGGVIFNSTGISGNDPNNPWEVLDNHNGRVLGRFNNLGAAEDYARTYGNDPMNTMQVSWQQVRKLRGEI